MELVDIINKCGVPPGVVNLLSGDPPSIASQLISSDIVKKISLTGSTRVGKIILKQAAEKIQRVTMELSGSCTIYRSQRCRYRKSNRYGYGC